MKGSAEVGGEGPKARGRRSGGAVVWAAAVLCGVGCGLTLLFAVGFFFSMHGEATYEPQWNQVLIPILFFAAAIAFTATALMRKAPRSGGVFALVAALSCLPVVATQGWALSVWAYMAIRWFIPTAPLLAAGMLGMWAGRRWSS